MSLIPAPPPRMADLPPAGVQGEEMGPGCDKLVCAGVSDSTHLCLQKLHDTSVSQIKVSQC